MPVRFGFTVFVLAASCLLVAGCRHRPSIPGDDLAPSAPAVSPKASSAGDAQGRNVPPRARASVSAGPDQGLISAHAHYAQAVIHEINNRPEQALAEYTEAARDDLGNEALLLEVSRRLLQARQTEQALDLLTAASARPGAPAAIDAQLGLVYSRMGRTEEGISASRTAIRKQPRALEGYRNLFVIWLQDHQPQEALAVLDEAARVASVGPEFLIGLGELYGNLSLQVPAQREIASSRGRAVLQRALDPGITDPQLLLRLADANNLLGNDAEAARIYQELLQKLPDVPFVRESIRAKLADIYLRDSDPKRAVEQLENLVKDHPTDPHAHFFLGRLAYDDHNYAQAAEHFGRVLLLDPSFERAYYSLAAAQLGQDQARDALVTLGKARQRFPQNFSLEHLTALAYTDAKDYTNAIFHFTAAEIIGRSTEATRLTEAFYFQFGAACERAGDYAQSEKHFEKCLELAPGFAEAQNYLGYMWAERGENLERARDLIGKALKAEPKNAAYLDSMGWVLFKLEQPQQALEYLLDAVRNSEQKDATLLDHLGDIYAALKEHEKAREAWRESLSVEPNEAVRKKLESSAGP